MSRVRLSRSKATAQAIFVFAVTVSLYAALLVLHTELSGEQSSIPVSAFYGIAAWPDDRLNQVSPV